VTKKIRIGALISGGGSNLQAIIDACRNGRIDGRVVYVGSDNPAAGGLDRARRENIPTFVVDYRSIIRETKAAPAKAVLPDDFDFDELSAGQALFSGRDDPAQLGFFLKTRAMAEARPGQHRSPPAPDYEHPSRPASGFCRGRRLWRRLPLRLQGGRLYGALHRLR